MQNVVPPPDKPSVSGFSLVELSIVLVILGLLVGGVLTGQSLIRAAELRSVGTEFSKYQAAVNTFRDKYFALPGDMNNATAFWGKDNTNCTTHTGSVATPGTCNGNGDGLVNYAAAASQTGEAYQFWKQLALSGLIEGSFSGLSGAGAFGHSVIRTNVPPSKLTNAGWTAEYLGFYGDALRYTLNYDNALVFGVARANSITIDPALKPEEAWNIDTKLDDGKPATSKIIAVFWNNLCSAADDGGSASTDLVASYRLSDTTIRCGFYFRQLF